MNQRQTSVAERNHFVDLKLQGHTLPEIAEATGLSFECLRKWWRCRRDGGRSALDPEDGRKQRGGRMSSFSVEMRAAFSEIKENHPVWGAPVARARAFTHGPHSFLAPRESAQDLTLVAHEVTHVL